MVTRQLPLLVSALLVLPALAHAQDSAHVQTVLVTGKALAETESQLKACLARNCPPREDIDASLAHAENQFIAGEYHAARSTLAAARGRNARYASQYPVEVADLIRAYGRLTDLDGYRNLSRLLQIESLDALKAGLDQGDSRVLMQRLMTGDEFARSGQIVAAINVYRKVAKQADKAKLPQVRGHAMFREAVLYGAVSEVRLAYRSTAEDAIRRIEKTTQPELGPFREAAGMLRASLASARGDKQAIDKAVASLGTKVNKPVLIYAPTVQVDQANVAPTGIGLASLGLDTGPQWIDVRFRIAADGTVHDVETLRQSDTVHGIWPKKVHEALAGRRYAPLRLAADDDGLARIERFTMVFDTHTPTGSRLRSLTLVGRLSSIDLTPEPAGSTPRDSNKGG
ncbi:hypothetical protein DAH66_18195 [Sphingomonas koreensis]|uniref:TonB C-terminal domain-containing protein n=1 Tax=Sphingomonas koreensis TaxID=93064 RepID=A0A430FZG2_9SPHN|nr:hypothetical protein [Sphingomonas koreensis]RSY78773.1 hypothetical protein DAH66_18195 [Sphingomonas koreensis]